MNFKTTAALLLSISSINPLHAASLITKITHPNSLNKTQSKEANLPYTDFTGTWTSAKCMGNHLTLVIDNTEEYLFLNGEEMAIGSMTTKSNSGVKNFFSTTTANSDIQSVEWNADKTQLIIKTISIDKTFADSTTQDPTTDISMHLSMNYATLELNNDRLRLKIKSAEYKDLQRIDSSQPTCIFTRDSE